MNDKDLERREYRRKRRIRNQTIAYIVLVLLLAILGVGGFFGVKRVITVLQDYGQKVTETMEQAAEDVQEQETQDNPSEEITQEQTQPEETEPEVVIDPLDELVDSLMADMTLEEKVAGMFLVSPEAITGVAKAIQAGDSTRKAIEQNPVGGLLYAEKNYQSKDQFVTMITNSQAYAKFPLFIAVKRECGASTAFGVTMTDGASDIADKETAAIMYALVGEGLSELGVNMNLAPLADVVAEDGNRDLQGRTFGSDGESIAPFVEASVIALQEKGISAVVNTFPGEGMVNDKRQLTKGVEEFKNSDFLSFAGVIKAGADAIMVSNYYASGILGEDIPACLSSVVIQELLRGYLGYQGVIATDFLNDTTVTSKYSAKDAAVQAILAGADLLVEPKSYKEAYEGVLEAVSNGTISEERINESIHRIYKVKYKHALDE